MSEAKKFWLKLERNFLQSRFIKIIKSMDNENEYILFYLALMLESVESVGHLRFTELVPYDEKMLAALTDINIDIVRSALVLFKNLGMIVILEDSTIFIPEVPRLTGKESESADRVRRFRANKATLSLQCNNDVTDCNSSVTNSNDNIEKSRVEKSRKEREKSAYAQNPSPRSSNSLKKACGPNKNVFLDEQEYISLTEQYGEANTRVYITRLSNHMSSKNKDYSNHSSTLSRWLEDDYQKGQIQLPTTPISMPTKCDKCGKPLVEGTCKSCGRRLYGSNGSYVFEDIPDQKEIEKLANRASSYF